MQAELEQIELNFACLHEAKEEPCILYCFAQEVVVVGNRLHNLADFDVIHSREGKGTLRSTSVRICNI